MSQGAWLATIALVVLGMLSPFAVQELEGVREFLPMHWPVMLAGLAFGMNSGLLVGIATTIVAYLVLPGSQLSPETGELLLYGLVTGAVSQSYPTLVGRTIALVAAIIAGRVVVLYAIARDKGFPPSFQDPALMYPLTGVLLQLVLLPICATLLARWLMRPPR
jgi:niacin transporter